MDWVAETRIQVGDPRGAPWPHHGVFLDGFAAGLRARGARNAEVLSPEDRRLSNPAGRVSFRFEAPDECRAQRLAEKVFFRAGLESGSAAVPVEGHPFGWVAGTEVRSA